MNFSLFKIQYKLFLFRFKLVLKAFGFWNGHLRFKKLYLDFSIPLSKNKGYGEQLIVDKLNRAAEKYNLVENSFIRDGILLPISDYDFNLLGIIYLLKKTTLNVLDFGGNLATSYIQHKELIRNSVSKWWILEQKEVVGIGKKYLKENKIEFCIDLNQVPSVELDILLFGSVLPYLESPYVILEALLLKHPKIVYVDRTYFLNFECSDFVMSQKMLGSSESYPVWLFNQKKFVDFLNKFGYKLISESISKFEFVPIATSRSLIFIYDRPNSPVKN